MKPFQWLWLLPALTAAAFLISMPAPVCAAPVPHWIPMPLLTAAQKKAGVFPGGEGTQWPRGPVAVSPTDPDFLLLPIDVGGLYRSLDGGKHWTVCMVGWNDRGANGFAIDPKNAKHVLGIAGNSMNWDTNWGPSPHGLYLSTDKAASWKQVLALSDAFHGAAAWDPTSYDAAKGDCTRAYFLTSGGDILASDDAGHTWHRASAAPATGTPGFDWTQGGGIPAMLTVDSKGAIFAAGTQGLFRSDDRGRTFAKLRTEEIDGFSRVSEDALFISGAFGVLKSQDNGRTFLPLPCHGLDRLNGKPVLEITVSPVNPRRMLCWVGGDNFNWVRYVSQDGGTSWQKVTLDSTNATLPTNARQGYFAWSSNNANIAWSIGGDWVSKSIDGGRTFHWSNNGYNGVMTGGLFNFNSKSPNIVMLGFQDYNGAFTTDGGQTWNYRNVSGKGWGGHEYGAFAADLQTMWAGDGDSWYTPRRLRLSRDGGTTWAFVNGPDGKPLEFHGADVSLADPSAPHIFFASDLRSADHGATWSRMNDCDGVFTSSPQTKALYGKKADAVVRSTDHGLTWTKIAAVEGGFVDLAVDHKSGRIYVASQDHLKVYAHGKWATLDTPADQYGNQRVWTVATDPQDPRIVYVGGPRNTYASQATVCRSTDAGKTWTNLTVTTPLAENGAGGPHEVGAIRVHPITREAWVAGQCYGLWRIAPPLPSERGLSAALASAPRAPTPPALAALPAALTVNNGIMEAH